MVDFIQITYMILSMFFGTNYLDPNGTKYPFFSSPDHTWCGNAENVTKLVDSRTLLVVYGFVT